MQHATSVDRNGQNANSICYYGFRIVSELGFYFAQLEGRYKTDDMKIRGFLQDLMTLAVYTLGLCAFWGDWDQESRDLLELPDYWVQCAVVATSDVVSGNWAGWVFGRKRCEMML